MANLYITEFGGLQADPSSPGMPCPVLPSLASQTVVFTGASVQSAAVGALTRLVRVLADANCFLASGANPTAVTQTPLVANVPEFFQVPAGQSFKLAVITRA
jgi:hypothetical protein